ncbi:DUF302 domain-containing protein [Sulfurivirga sp.]|uniref:DUF302 domain-containing protein n=1 Tax=Sulfurivirga sp. TaxID=2614236 RepID=UPI0025D33B40|nr:DUF302 domain-containing protein [Sulfurivirga sp.]
MNYALSKNLDCSVDEAVERIKALAPEHQLGVVYELDIQQTIQNKLGEDFRPYRILGLCNPKIAKDALEKDADFGALLPCAVAVHETADGKARLSFYNLPAIVEAIGNAAFDDWNRTVIQKMQGFMDAL